MNPTNQPRLIGSVLLASALCLVACDKANSGSTKDADPQGQMADDHGHDHGDDGHSHDDAEGTEAHPHGDDFELGPITLGEDTFEVWQSHGNAEPGKELHLSIDGGSMDSGGRSWGDVTLRAWIGTADRLSSLVARGEYDTENNRFNAHAIVPDPTPEGSAWWIEMELPDGTKHVSNVPLQ